MMWYELSKVMTGRFWLSTSWAWGWCLRVARWRRSCPRASLVCVLFVPVSSSCVVVSIVPRPVSCDENRFVPCKLVCWSLFCVVQLAYSALSSQVRRKMHFPTLSETCQAKELNSTVYDASLLAISLTCSVLFSVVSCCQKHSVAAL